VQDRKQFFLSKENGSKLNEKNNKIFWDTMPLKQEEMTESELSEMGKFDSLTVSLMTEISFMFNL